MQETRSYVDGAIKQRVYTSETLEALTATMDAALTDDEELIRRVELSKAEFNSYNRHERRKMAKLARKKK